ncbi:bis-aminopropyl spermidine synthase family protein [Stackebrandtia nassauensis]|uniref:N(4)-bis(aminopropyl)spermidine synthase C-terminal domain-containing protein n=1 Tax=Stackebrandtia nassauensis (strain DSM 44728 / CIP 108903 / NRRL B-16338 / NBRC 102104 / LLR-40K-21) TaxID=446470 RepID=D3PVB3_STANL|nr:bis-aminopropyl spermidine synthase family protein [Stackebrandtia nassauensis]ADD41166.1 protein of unknown function DUF43 [Stackebrandtia nassauensis DSM 44728]
MTCADSAASTPDRSRVIDRRDVNEIATQVARAVDLAEGAWGVVDVLRAIARHEPVAVRELSRHVELPVPIVAAIGNELRKRGIVDTQRPVRLTEVGRMVMGTETWLDSGDCPTCAGRGITVPAELDELADELSGVAERMPGARMELDQAHCTVDTKLRRVMLLSKLGVLAKPMIFIGDDDLTSLAVAMVAKSVGLPIGPMTVVDVDEALLDYIAAQARELGTDLTAVHHDATRPLPEALREGFAVALTDPPYTLAGAELFLSRAVSALEPRPGQHLLFSFGGRRPAETVAVQALIAGMGLAVRSLVPNFNEYLGAGILGGTSHLYHLRTVDGAAPSIDGDFDGPLYTADNRTESVRGFRCAACKTVQPVGPGQRFARIAELKAAGCPECGATTFRPLPLTPR